MEGAAWFGNNWFIFLQSAGIIGSLLFTGISIGIDARARRVSNLLTLTQQHRDIWENLYARPELIRVLDPAANLPHDPVTTAEEVFVILLILHLNAAYRAIRGGFLRGPDELQRDVQTFFSLPIPRIVWERAKNFQDKDFVRFVDAARRVDLTED